MEGILKILRNPPKGTQIKLDGEVTLTCEFGQGAYTLVYNSAHGVVSSEIDETKWDSLKSGNKPILEMVNILQTLIDDNYEQLLTGSVRTQLSLLTFLLKAEEDDIAFFSAARNEHIPTYRADKLRKLLASIST